MRFSQDVPRHRVKRGNIVRLARKGDQPFIVLKRDGDNLYVKPYEDAPIKSRNRAHGHEPHYDHRTQGTKRSVRDITAVAVGR